MTYENGGQLDRALKKAVRDKGGDPGDGYRQALRDRFLCRVFSDPDGRFILKGGKRAARAHSRRPRHARHRLRDGIAGVVRGRARGARRARRQGHGGFPRVQA